MKILKTLKEFSLKHYLVKRALLKTNEKNLETMLILEQYITECMMAGEQHKRSTLIDIQNRVDESRKTINFLKKLK